MTAPFATYVKEELKQARRGQRPINSRHQALGVILEEVEEFKATVFRKKPDADDMLCELVQIAAMCQRAAEDLGACSS